MTIFLAIAFLLTFAPSDTGRSRVNRDHVGFVVSFPRQESDAALGVR
jgi:hypothetical protein